MFLDITFFMVGWDWIGFGGKAALVAFFLLRPPGDISETVEGAFQD